MSSAQKKLYHDRYEKSGLSHLTEEDEMREQTPRTTEQDEVELALQQKLQAKLASGGLKLTNLPALKNPIVTRITEETD